MAIKGKRMWTDREVSFLLTAHDVAGMSKEGRWYQGLRSPNRRSRAHNGIAPRA